MRFERAVAPAVPLLTTDEAKRYLRVTHTDADNDAEIDALILAVEAAMSGPDGLAGVALINQDWDFWTKLPSADDAVIRIPFYPAVTLVEVSYLDADGVTQTMDVADLVLRAMPRQTEVTPVAAWPAMADRPDALRIRITYGHGTAVTDVPQSALLAAKLLLAHYYTNRGIVGGRGEEMPMGVASLLGPVRRQFNL